MYGCGMEGSIDGAYVGVVEYQGGTGLMKHEALGCVEGMLSTKPSFAVWEEWIWANASVIASYARQ